MIIEEFLENNRIRHYSNSNHMIRQIETGHVYEDAIDVLPCRYTYEEVEALIEDEEVLASRLLDIIVGGE